MNPIRRLHTSRVLRIVLLTLASGTWSTHAKLAPQPAVVRQIFLPLVAKGSTPPTPPPAAPPA